MPIHEAVLDFCQKREGIQAIWQVEEKAILIILSF
jgi:hypothetical protein